jgi:replicative DNA helicase
LVCQLSREVEKRSDKKPMLSDLRDSGEIEQNTDVALFLWRPHYYGLNHPEDYAQIIIAKNRNGPTGAVEVSWRKEQMLFGNKAKEYEIPGF